MADLKKIDQYLASRGYDPNARLADYRDPNAYQAPKAAPPKGNFLGNVGKSLSGIPGAVVGGVAKTLGGTSFAKIPQVLGGIGSAGFSGFGINSGGRQGQILNRRDAMFAQANKDFHAGKIDAKGYAKKLQDAIKATDITQERKKTEGALKDASRYGEQFVNNALVIGTAVGGIAGAAGKTGLNAAGTAAVDQAYSGGLRALGRGVIGEVGGLSPFQGQAAGGFVKGITGAAGGALDAQAMASTVNDARKGKIDPLNAALTATSLAPGGIVKLGGEALGKVGKGTSKLLYDTSGVFDQVHVKGGDVLSQISKIKNPTEKAKLEDVYRVAQDNILNQYGSPKAAVKAFSEYVGKENLSKMSVSDLAKELDALATGTKKTQSLVQKAIKKGSEVVTADGKVLNIHEVNALGAVKSTQPEKAALTKLLAETKNPEEARAAISKFFSENPRFASNAQNKRILEDISNAGIHGKSAASMIGSGLKGTNQVFIRDAKGVMKPIRLENGFYGGLRNIKSAGFKNAAETGDLIKGHPAVFGGIGNILEKAGIGTREANPAEQRAIFNQVKTSFVKAINEKDVGMGGDEILNRLSKIADDKPGVFDLRQLSQKEVADALGSDKTSAKQILSAYNDAFKSLSYSDRGLGGKITDFNMRNNPLAAPYSRIQSVARYEKNPFFKTQENIETRAGVAALTGKNAAPGTTKYNDVIKDLRDKGVFKDYFSGTAGEGSAGLGAISAKLSKDQENVIASALTSMAGDKKKVLTFISDPKNASLMQDLKAVVQYPDKGFTSSNLMKAMNLAVFPLRYNLKVTSLAAKALGKENGVRQVAILKGLSDFNRWQKTPDGIKWNSDNSEALGILRYFTPIGSVESALRLLSPGEVRGIKDLGQIGGLPFGVISRVLQGQGVTKSATPYINPKTGEVVPDKIPQDAKARARQALADIIDTMFTFPGRLVDAPVSKKQLSEGAADWATLGTLKGGKYESVTRTDLTDKQKKTQAVLRAGQAGSVPKTPSTMQNRSVDISTKKPVSITPIYKTNSKGKRVKAKASAPGTWRP